MKNHHSKLLAALLCLSLIQYANAQSISIGARGGILLANMDFKPTETNEPDYKPIIAPQGALFAEIGIGSFFAIQPEIMYGTHGAKYKDSATETLFGTTYSYDDEGTIKINTLEIPILAKIKLGPDAIKFHVLAGPSIGFGLSGSSEYKGTTKITIPGGGSSTDSYNEKADAVFVKDGFNYDDIKETEVPISKTNLNVHFGAGVNFKMGNLSFFLDGRYILGISDLIPDYKDAASDEKYEGKSTRIGISAGVMFTLGGDDF
jgi:hypothetical protein